MHSLPEVLAELLRSLDMATDPLNNPQGPWPLFVGQMDTDPDEVIAIYDTAQPTNGRIQRTGETIGLEGYQLRTRALDYGVGSKKIREIATAFDEVLRVQLPIENDLYEIQGVHRETSIVYIGPDPNNRQNFTFNGTASFRKV